jgi:predicted Ser/Thr protein kinase
MPLATIIAEMIESGKVTISANNVETLEIKAANKKIDINALNKEFLKQSLAAARDGKKSRGTLERIKATVNQIKTAQSSLSQLKEVAEELSEVGITVTLS